jgi:hypothetical protein
MGGNPVAGHRIVRYCTVAGSKAARSIFIFTAFLYTAEAPMI